MKILISDYLNQIELKKAGLKFVQDKYPNAWIDDYWEGDYFDQFLLNYLDPHFTQCSIDETFNYFSFFISPIKDRFIFDNKKYPITICPDQDKIDLFHTSNNRLYIYKYFHKLSSTLLPVAEDKIIECFEKNPHLKIHKKTKLTPRLSKLVNFI